MAQTAPLPMDKLAEALGAVGRRFVLHWGEMGSRWGVNRTVSQIHALLFLLGRPLHAEEIAGLLQVARSNVSNSLRELENRKLVRVVHHVGDRRDHFETAKDPWELLRTIVRERKAREFDPTIDVLQGCVDDPGFARLDAQAQKRVGDTLALMQTLSKWTDEMLALETTTLSRLVKLGAKVRGLIGGRSPQASPHAVGNFLSRGGLLRCQFARMRREGRAAAQSRYRGAAAVCRVAPARHSCARRRRPLLDRHCRPRGSLPRRLGWRGLAVKAIRYPLTVFYDASCPMCASEILALKERDRESRLVLVDCSAAEFDAEVLAGTGITRSDLMTRMHARDAHGRWLAALDAIEAAYRAAGLERAARFWGARGLGPAPHPPSLRPPAPRPALSLRRAAASGLVATGLRRPGASLHRISGQSCGRTLAITVKRAPPSGRTTAISPSARYGGPATAWNGVPWLEMTRFSPFFTGVESNFLSSS